MLFLKLSKEQTTIRIRGSQVRNLLNEVMIACWAKAV